MVASKEDMLARALELADILERMERTGTYFRSEDHIRINQLLDELRPACDAAGVQIMYRPSGEAPRTWHRGLKGTGNRLIGFLRADNRWMPEAGPPDPAGWMHPRLWDFIGGIVRMAESSGRAQDWETVTQRAITFLEDEVRRRANVSSGRRRDVAPRALHKEDGPLRLGDDDAQADDWRMFGQGLLGAVGSPVAHSTRGHERSYAMGVAGAVSLLLTAIDETHPGEH